MHALAVNFMTLLSWELITEKTDDDASFLKYGYVKSFLNSTDLAYVDMPCVRLGISNLLSQKE